MSTPESAPPASSKSGPRTNPALPTEAGLRQVTMTVSATGDRPSGNIRASDSRIDPYIGATVDGRYLVEKVLGEGGMGVVYRCRHTIIDKLVAMKVLRADLARNEEVTERFLNEARSASSIGNPHIIDISDFGRLPDGATYFIMEYLDGAPLAAVLDEHKALPPERTLKIATQLAEALSAAHDGGIIHRDLKPDNIFLLRRGTQTDFVKVLDFGIAKASATNSKLTQAGQVFGTPHYMSPEQAAGSPVDHRSDIYAVGVILYEMATGRLPFDAENFMAILTQHMYKAPTPPSELPGLKQTVAPELEAVILKCLSKQPEDRYDSMSALSADLGRLSNGDRPEAVRDMQSRADGGLPPGFSDRRRASGEPAAQRSRFFPFALGTIALGFGMLGIWFVRSQRALPDPMVSVGPEIAVGPALVPTQAVVALPAPAAQSAKSVAVAVSPLDAHVFRGSEDLGESPVVIEVGTEPADLEVRHDGYKTRRLVLDGSEPKVSITLEKITSLSKRPAVASKSVKPAPTSITPAKPKKPGSELIVNPWD